MSSIGNFFFRYRNWIFILFYAALFLPSPALFPEWKFGANYYWWPVVAGLIITVKGQLIRGLTIGLAYIVRGGKDGKPYAEGLVTEGIFHHCRNPLYLGNIVMLLGVGVLANSMIYVLVIIPVFLFVYQAIVLAEEDFLRKTYGDSYEQYCKRVNRWMPDLKGIGQTVSGMHFNWRRWILKEHTTQFIWLGGITLILLFKYPQLTNNDVSCRNTWLIAVFSVLSLVYILIRVLKSTGKFRE